MGSLRLVSYGYSTLLHSFRLGCDQILYLARCKLLSSVSAEQQNLVSVQEKRSLASGTTCAGGLCRFAAIVVFLFFFRSLCRPSLLAAADCHPTRICSCCQPAPASLVQPRLPPAGRHGLRADRPGGRGRRRGCRARPAGDRTARDGRALLPASWPAAMLHRRPTSQYTGA